MKHKRTSNQSSPVEIFKDILLVLLLCSAFYLLWEAQLFITFSNPLSSTQEVVSTETQVYQIQAEAARPIRMAVITDDNTLYGAQYDDTMVDSVFQLSANLFRETLGSLDDETLISESQWQSYLSTAPGFYYDMLGDVPLSILTGWFSGEEDPALTDVPRRMLLTIVDDLVALCYQTQDGNFYCATTQVVDPVRLRAAATQYSSNGAQFAFQTEEFSTVDSYTLLLSDTPQPSIYYANNPMADEDSILQLLSILSLNSQSQYTYTSTEGLGVVLRNETDTLRISGVGTVSYQGESGLSPFTIPSSSAVATSFDVVEGCRSLASTMVSSFCGDVQLHLLSVYEEDDAWIVNFSYTLNGIPIQFSNGSNAAQFTVTNGEIVEFTIHLRSYSLGEESTTLLPQSQAAAAMESLGYGQQELTLRYYDSYLPIVYADWAASDR